MIAAYIVTDAKGKLIPDAVVTIPDDAAVIRAELCRLVEAIQKHDPQLSTELAYVINVKLARHVEKKVKG